MNVYIDVHHIASNHTRQVTFKLAANATPIDKPLPRPKGHLKNTASFNLAPHFSSFKTIKAVMMLKACFPNPPTPFPPQKKVIPRHFCLNAVWPQTSTLNLANTLFLMMKNKRTKQGK